MKKTTLIIIVAVLAVIGLGGYVGVRLYNRGTDLIGVTTRERQNQVIMNAKTGEEFVAGSGKLTVGAGESIRLKYTLSAGSFDLALHKGEEGNGIFQETDLENLPDAGAVYGKSGVSGSGELNFPAEEGVYTVFFNMHGAIGSATMTAEKE